MRTLVGNGCGFDRVRGTGGPFLHSASEPVPFYRNLRNMDIETTFNTASQQYESGNLREAEKLFRSILKLKKGFMPAYYGLALCLMNNEDYQGASELLSEGITQLLRSTEPLNTNHLLLWELRAEALVEMADFDNAIYDYRLLLLKQPENLEIRKKLAVVLQEAGKFQEAIQELTLVLESEPDNIALLLQRGEASLEADRPDRALADFERAYPLCSPGPIKEQLEELTRLTRTRLDTNTKGGG